MAITNAGQEKVLRCGKKINFGQSSGHLSSKTGPDSKLV